MLWNHPQELLQAVQRHGASALTRVQRIYCLASHAAKGTASRISSRFAAGAQVSRDWIRRTFIQLNFLGRAIAAFTGPSLKRVAAEVHKHHFRRNPTIKAFRYSWWRLQMNAIANHPFRWLTALALVVAGGAFVARRFIPEVTLKWLTAELKHRDFQDVAVGLLAAQAALIALVFPLIIALIGVLFELRTTAGGRLNIFLKETEALFVGGSALMLSAALAIQLLLFPHLVETLALLFVSLDVGWFVLNTFFLTFFLFSTLNFVRPERRTILFRRYIVNVTWRQELLNLITYNRLTNAIEYGYLPSTPGNLETGAKVLISPMTLDSIPPAVRISLSESSILSNVFLSVLRVVAHSWLETTQHRLPDRTLAWLVFDPIPTRIYSGDVVLARVPNNLPLTPLQRFLIGAAFHFQGEATQS